MEGPKCSTVKKKIHGEVSKQGKQIRHEAGKRAKSGSKVKKKLKKRYFKKEAKDDTHGIIQTEHRKSRKSTKIIFQGKKENQGSMQNTVMID